MKNVMIMIGLAIASVAGLNAQEDQDLATFRLGPEIVKIDNKEWSTSQNGNFIASFSDKEYSIEVNSKIYQVNMLIEAVQIEAVQKTISRILDGENATFGYEKMVWKKTAPSKKPMYEVELERNRLIIRVYRKQMDDSTYTIINALGRELLREFYY